VVKRSAAQFSNHFDGSRAIIHFATMNSLTAEPTGPRIDRLRLEGVFFA
jgi:hypothetical protein